MSPVLIGWAHSPFGKHDALSLQDLIVDDEAHLSGAESPGPARILRINAVETDAGITGMQSKET